MADDDNEVRITLRLPAALRDRIAKEASQSGRSMNGEMVFRLEKTLTDEDKVSELEDQVANLGTRMDEVEQALIDHWREIKALMSSPFL